MNHGGVMTSSILTPAGPPAARTARNRSLACMTPIDVVGLAAIERDAGVGRRQHLRHDRIGRLVGVDQHDVAAMGHDVADRAVAEIEDGAQHRLLGRRIVVRCAAAVQLDGAAQQLGMFLPRRAPRSTFTPISAQEDPRRSRRPRAPAGPSERQGEQDRRRQRQRQRSARRSAQVLGITSAKTTTRMPTIIVA